MKKTKLFVLACSSLLLLGSVTGCGGKDPNANKVKIYTANFGGGIGNEWLKNAADRYMEKMKDHKFDSGKVGVYINTDYSDFDVGAKPGMESDTRSIYFDERMSDVQELARGGYLHDLSTVVNDTNRTGGTLESKIFGSIKDSLQVGGKYYGLPHYEYYGGLSYNREVFENIGALFVDETCPKEKYFSYKTRKVTGLSGNFASEFYGQDGCVLSAGPDGVKGTLDDGLPRTIEEFVVLMDYIKFKNYSPVALSGQYNRYLDYLVSGLWASFAGADQMRNYYNCTGEIEVVKRDSSGNYMYDGLLIPGISYVKKPVTEKITMSADGKQGYYGNDMVAKYYALAVCDIIYNEGFFTANASIGTNSHYDAQGDLFLGAYASGYEKAAMLVEGTYWYNETEEFAKNLTKYENYSGKSAKDLDLRWMSLPVSVNNSDYKAKEQCLLDIGHSYTMVNKNIENDKELESTVLDFLAFLYSEEELANFTICTGMSRMIDYSVPETRMNEFEPYYKKLYEQRKANTNNVIGLSGNTEAFTLNKSMLKIELQSNCIREAYDTSARTLYAIYSTKTHSDEVFKSYSTKNSWINPTN